MSAPRSDTRTSDAYVVSGTREQVEVALLAERARRRMRAALEALPAEHEAADATRAAFADVEQLAAITERALRKEPSS